MDNDSSRGNNNKRYNGSITSIIVVGFIGTLVAQSLLTEFTELNNLSSAILQTFHYNDDMKTKNKEMVNHHHYEGEDYYQRWTKYAQRYSYHPPSMDRDSIPSLQKTTVRECGHGSNYDEFFNLGQEFHSRFQEDRTIYQRFFQSSVVQEQQQQQQQQQPRRRRRRRRYVELGAFDGKTESNTRFFDFCLEWDGLLIEGNPESYQKVVMNRPFAHRMSFAPSCSSQYEAVNRTIQFYKYPMANAGLPGHAVTYQGKPTVDVPCGPLTPVLLDLFPKEYYNNSIDDNNDDYHATMTTTSTASPMAHIDFFSLDVEGSEPLVLNTIDFNQVQVDVLMIEVKNNFCTNDDCETRKQVRKTMEQAGYYLHKEGSIVPASDVYVHPNFQKSLKRKLL